MLYFVINLVSMIDCHLSNVVRWVPHFHESLVMPNVFLDYIVVIQKRNSRHARYGEMPQFLLQFILWIHVKRIFIIINSLNCDKNYIILCVRSITQNPLLDHVKKNPRKQNTQPGLLLFLEYGPTRLSPNRPLPYSQNDTTLLFPKLISMKFSFFNIVT